MRRLGKAVSRTADVGDSVIVSSKIEDATITLADVDKYSSNHSIVNTVSGRIVIHGLGAVPSAIILTQISSVKIGNLHYMNATTSSLQIGTDVSGSYLKVVCIA